MRRTRAGEEGASAVEYALLAALIAAVIVLAVATLGTTTADMFGKPCQQAGSPCASGS